MLIQHSRIELCICSCLVMKSNFTHRIYQSYALNARSVMWLGTNQFYLNTLKDCSTGIGTPILLPQCNSSQWRNNELDGVSNYQPRDCLLNRLFTRRSNKTSKFRVTGLCVGNSPVTGEFPAQMASNAENVSVWWRHHVELTWRTLKRKWYHLAKLSSLVQRQFGGSVNLSW